MNKSLLQNQNVVAFLLMIRKSEGTSTENGYQLLFGGKQFSLNKDGTWPDHPRIYFKYKNKAGITINTSAAGAYQIIYTTWLGLKKQLSLDDFSPTNQDLAALYLINDSGAIDDIVTGKFEDAVNKVRKIWASLPGSNCDQPEHSFADVTKWYQEAGGQIV